MTIAELHTSSSSNSAMQIRVNGRTFLAAAEMAGIFVQNVRRALVADDHRLVLLRHTAGIEIIPVTRRTPILVTAADSGSARDSRPDSPDTTTTDPGTVDPDTATQPDGSPVENPSG